MIRRPRRLVAVVAVLVLLATGCTYYPTVREIGGVRLRPEKGRAVASPMANEAVVYFDLDSSGKYGDALTGAEAPFAKRAALVGPDGAPVARIEIPGATVVKFEERGPRVVLSELTRPLTPGEVLVVTLLFEKSGRMGVVTVVQ